MPNYPGSNLYKTFLLLIIVMMVLVAIVMAVWLVCLSVSYSGGQSQGTIFSFWASDDGNEDRFVVSSAQEHALDGTTQLRLNFSSEHVRVIPSDESVVRVVQRSREALGEKYWPRIEQSGNTLRIDVPFHRWTFSPFSFQHNTVVIDIYLPQSYSHDLSAHISSGEFELRDFRLETLDFGMSSGDVFIGNVDVAQSLSIELSSGDITLDGLACDRFSLGVTSGNTQINDLAVQSEAMFRTSSGDINGRGITAKTLRSQVTSGDVNLAGAFDHIEAQTSSGNHSIQTTVQPQTLDVDVTSGDCKITIPDNKGFTLDYQKTSGDIDTDFDLPGFHSDNRNGVAQYQNGSDVYQYRFRLSSGNISLRRA